MPVKVPKKKPSKKTDLFNLTEEITSGIGVGIYIVQNGKFVYISVPYKKMTSYSDSELLGKNSLEHVYPDDRAMVREKAIKSLKSKNPKSYEYRYVKKNGDIIWILEMTTSVKHEGRRAALGSFMDITERKKAEKELAASEQRLKNAQSHAHIGSWELDVNTQNIYWSEEMLRLFELDPASRALSFKEYLKVIHPDDAKRIRHLLPQSIADQKQYDDEYRIILRDGSVRWIYSQRAPVFDKSGKMIKYAGTAQDITERKKMEGMLRQSEERYRTVMEEIEEGYYEIDLQGNFTFVSDAICTTLGYSREELIGMNFKSYVPEELWKSAYKIWAKSYETGKAIKWFPLINIRKDGTRVNVEDYITPLRGKEGKIIGFKGITREITERERMEEAIRLSEEKYQALLEDMEEGYFELDLDGTFTFANDAQCRNIGYPREELIGKNHRQFQDEIFAQEMRQIFTELYRTGKPVRLLDVVIIKKDGGKIFNEVSVSLLHDNKGNPIGFKGISRNVTERRKMEEIIRQSEEKYRNILETMQESYFEVDLAGNLTYVNYVMHTNLGFTKEELIGKHYRVFTDETNVKKLYQIYNTIYKTGRPVRTADFEFTRKDGTKLLAETSASLIRDTNGKIIGFRGVSRDVTERRQLEEEIRQSEEKYRTIIDAMDEWYFEIDMKGNLVFVNDAVVRNVDYSLKELIGLNYTAFSKNEQAAEVYDMFAQIYETGEPIRGFPYELNRLDGSKSFFEVSIFPKKNQDDKIIGFRGVAQDITKRKLAEKKLNYMVTHDLLTNLPNRTLLTDRLKMAIAQAKRNDQKLAVMMLDLDNFKNVNDTLGHLVGDELLKEISSRLTGRLRQNDTISRLGGDEFIILLPAIETAQDAVEVAKIVLESFEQPFVCNGHEISTSISIGIAIYPDDCQDMDSLLKNSDMAMYYVKAHGRNGYHLFAHTNIDHAGQSVQ
jgi:diguanylate cyclase (GGDEF)-like protein/PAS domain S-box-containing protein